MAYSSKMFAERESIYAKNSLTFTAFSSENHPTGHAWNLTNQRKKLRMFQDARRNGNIP